MTCAESLVGKVISNTRRTMDIIAGRCYFFYARAYEVNGKLSSIRRFMLARLRTATLRQDEEGQAHLINSLLRSYIQDNLYDQAEKLVGKLTYPEYVHNNQLARFQYYLGRIKATKLDYSEAHQHLLQASRKAPTNGATGFKQTVSLDFVRQLIKIKNKKIKLHFVGSKMARDRRTSSWRYPGAWSVSGERAPSKFGALLRPHLGYAFSDKSSGSPLLIN